MSAPLPIDPQGRTARTTSSLEAIAWTASSNFFRQILGAVTAFLRPMLLTPDLFGLFLALRLVPMYGQHLHMGARHALRYRIPLHQEHGEHDEVRRLQGTVFWGTLGFNMLSAAVLLALAAFTDWRIEVRIGLVICAVTVIVGAVSDHYVAELKGFQRFKSVGLYNYFNAVALLVVSVILIFWLGFYGALLAQVVVACALLALMIMRGFARMRHGFDRRLLWGAITLGGPTMLFDLSLLMMRSADRLVIIGYLGPEELGYYGLGAMMMGYVMNIPGATREVMEAKIFQNLRGNSAQAAFRAYVLQPMVMVGLSMTVLIGPVVLGLPLLVGTLLPSYAVGIPAAQVLVLGGYFLALSYPMRGILAAYNWQGWGATIMVGSVGVHLGLSALLLSLGHGIVGVAVSAGFSFLLAAAGLLALVLFRLGERPVGLGRDILRMVLPFFVMIGVLYAEMRVAAELDWPLWLITFIQMAVYGAFLLLAGWALLRTGLLPPVPPKVRRLMARVLRIE